MNPAKRLRVIERRLAKHDEFTPEQLSEMADYLIGNGSGRNGGYTTLSESQLERRSRRWVSYEILAEKQKL